MLVCHNCIQEALPEMDLELGKGGFFWPNFTESLPFSGKPHLLFFDVRSKGGGVFQAQGTPSGSTTIGIGQSISAGFRRKCH